MAEELMETDHSKTNGLETKENTTEENAERNFPDGVIDHLISCKDAYFKSQQRGEKELTDIEKKDIANKIFSTSKSGFLSRFGKQLKEEHLELFKQYQSDENDGYAVGYYLADLKRYFTKAKRDKDIKNRRYDALKKLVEDNSYFTETEMMKRNPLLYDQLVGQYLSEDEKKKRDNIDTKNITFVNLLLESIDRDTIKKKQKQQEMEEDDVKEEEDTEDENEENEKETKNRESDSWDEEMPSTARWGEFSSSEEQQPQPFSQLKPFFFNQEPPREMVMITATERRLLKEEFISIMYQNFLDGKDAEFDYSKVDDNDEYDNIEIKTHDAEDTYFDSETPEDVQPEVQPDEKMSHGDTSEDELDAFMSRLNKHPTVQQLSADMDKL